MLLHKIKTFIHNPKVLIEKLIFTAQPILSEEVYLKCLFRYRLGYCLNLKNPKSFSEKLQWLKLKDHNPEYTTMVDKFLVKEYVGKKIGQKYVIPTYGIWNTPEEIDWDNLPSKFVLKTTHGSGGSAVIICHDKAKLDKKEAMQKMQRSMGKSVYKNLREWPYKNVTPRIIAEELLPSENGKVPVDYKFYCFNGVPKAFLIATERFSSHHAYFDYFDIKGNLLPFTQGALNNPNTPTIPDNFEEMKTLAEILSKGIPHVRVDFYSIDNKVYFGELTFYDASGLCPFEPRDWDYIWGSWLTLPEK